MLLHWSITLQSFITLFDILNKYYIRRCVDRSVAADNFFGVLVKMRMNPPMEDLAKRLRLHPAHFSRIFHKWLDIMYLNLKQLIAWPDSDIVNQNMPHAFKNGPFEKVRCIIDCFEVFIECPVSFAARAATYSNYKKHNTVKALMPLSRLALFHSYLRLGVAECQTKY